jgi:DNA-binding transcriptional ArsR family regulator
MGMSTPTPGPRRLTEPVELRALAHPARLKLLTAVAMHGTLTATQAAGILGGNPAAAAYHLRTLGKYGFIEDAGGGSARERPWKLTTAGFQWNEQAGDAEQRTVARALGDVVYTEWLSHIEQFRARRDHYPAAVQQISGAAEIILFATPDEIAELHRQIDALATPFLARISDPTLRPPGQTPMEMILFTHPVEPPAP